MVMVMVMVTVMVTGGVPAFAASPGRYRSCRRPARWSFRGGRRCVCRSDASSSTAPHPAGGRVTCECMGTCECVGTWRQLCAIQGTPLSTHASSTHVSSPAGRRFGARGGFGAVWRHVGALAVGCLHLGGALVDHEEEDVDAETDEEHRPAHLTDVGEREAEQEEERLCRRRGVSGVSRRRGDCAEGEE